jgi:hypothetical protein
MWRGGYSVVVMVLSSRVKHFQALKDGFADCSDTFAVSHLKAVLLLGVQSAAAAFG